MKHMLPLIAALALAACATPPPPVPPGPVAGLGEPADVNGLRLRPQQVLEDSRCPANVECIWAGRFRLKVSIGAPQGGEITQRDLTLGEPADVYGGRLTLIRVDPPKGASGSLDQDSYQFTFAFER